MANDSPSNGDPLALPARHGFGLSIQQRFNIQYFCGFQHPLLNLFFIEPPYFQAEGQVLVGCHVRVKSVVLEDDGNIPVLGRDVIDQGIPNVQLSATDLFQAGHHAQQGGFAATGRAY